MLSLLIILQKILWRIFCRDWRKHPTLFWFSCSIQVTLQGGGEFICMAKVFLLGEKKEPFSGMEDADLFLMGSYYEGFPNVLLEAGAHGIPVIAFNAPGGIAEIITGKENGLLVDDNDIIGFADSINKCLAVNFNRNTIIETTQKRFSINNIIPVLEKLFLSLTVNK